MVTWIPFGMLGLIPPFFWLGKKFSHTGYYWAYFSGPWAANEDQFDGN